MKESHYALEQHLKLYYFPADLSLKAMHRLFLQNSRNRTVTRIYASGQKVEPYVSYDFYGRQSLAITGGKFKFERERRDVCNLCFTYKSQLSCGSLTERQRIIVNMKHVDHLKSAARRREFMRYDLKRKLKYGHEIVKYGLPKWSYLPVDEDDRKSVRGSWDSLDKNAREYPAYVKSRDSFGGDYRVSAILFQSIDDGTVPARRVALTVWEGYEKKPTYRAIHCFFGEKYYITWHLTERLTRENADIFRVDYMQILSLPRLESRPQIQYYLRSLSVVPMGIYDAQTGITTVYCRSEYTAGRTADDTINAWQKHLFSTMNRRKKPFLIIWADDCTAQNKNWLLLHYFAELVHRNIYQKVIIKYLRVGHTYLPNDAAFGTIRDRMAGRYDLCQ